MRGQQPWQVLKDRTAGFNIVTPRLFDSVNICAAKTHCKGVQIYILILQGRGFESITLDSFFFLYVDSYIKPIKNTPACSERACEAEEL